jgi:hypothetical protein
MDDIAVIDTFLKHLYDKGNKGACLVDVVSLENPQRDRVETTLTGKGLVEELPKYVAGKKRFKLSDVDIDIIQNHSGSFQKWVDVKNEASQPRTTTIHAEKVAYVEGDNYGSQSFSRKATIENAKHKNQPIQNDKKSKFMTFISKFWWTFVIPLAVTLIALAVENDWFNINGAK